MKVIIRNNRNTKTEIKKLGCQLKIEVAALNSKLRKETSLTARKKVMMVDVAVQTMYQGEGAEIVKFVEKGVTEEEDPMVVGKWIALALMRTKVVSVDR